MPELRMEIQTPSFRLRARQARDPVTRCTLTNDYCREMRQRQRCRANGHITVHSTVSYIRETAFAAAFVNAAVANSSSHKQCGLRCQPHKLARVRMLAVCSHFKSFKFAPPELALETMSQERAQAFWQW